MSNELTIKDVRKEVNGENSNRIVNITCNLHDVLLVTVHYILGRSYIQTPYKFSFRLLVEEPGVVTIAETENCFNIFCDNHLSSIFSSSVKFTKITYKFINFDPDNVRQLLLSNVSGKLDTSYSSFKLGIKVQLTSEREQILKLYGVPREVLSWDQGDLEAPAGEIAMAYYRFSRGFQQTLKVGEQVKVSTQGFHYGTRHRDQVETVKSLIPLELIQVPKKPKQKKEKSILVKP